MTESEGPQQRFTQNTVKLIKFKISYRLLDPVSPKMQLKQQQIKIVLTLPNPSPHIMLHPAAHSPQCQHSIQHIASEYYSLFGGANPQPKPLQQPQPQPQQQPQLLHQQDEGSRIRRLNMGERIKNKLESTNNKSANFGNIEDLNQHSTGQDNQLNKMKHNVRNMVREFVADDTEEQEVVVHPFQCEDEQNLYQNQQSREQQAEGSHDSNINTNKYCDLQQGQLPWHQQYHKQSHYYSHQHQHQHQQQQEQHEAQSHNSSPYNNISAKTQRSPTDGNCGDSQSPIKQLEDIGGDDADGSVPACKIELLNFGTPNPNQQSSYQEQHQYQQNHGQIQIRVKGPESPDEQDEDLFQNSIKVVSSRVIDRPYLQTPLAFESRCLPCSEKPTEPLSTQYLPAYQYAMQQLEEMKQNVARLELSTHNLISLKGPTPQQQQFSFLPSSINKSPHAHNIDQSFIMEIVENLQHVMEDNQDESLLIGDSRHEDMGQDGQKICEGNRYATPNHPEKQKNMGQNRILSEWAMRDNRRQVPDKITRILLSDLEPSAYQQNKQNKHKQG